MATKLEYLKLCIQNLKPIEYKSWYYYMFTTLFPKDEHRILEYPPVMNYIKEGS